jgi:hypothetical protein
MPTDASGRDPFFAGFSTSHSISSRYWILGLSALLCALATATHAQTRASCTFTSFPIVLNRPNNVTATLHANGVNDFRTVVGSANFTDVFGDSLNSPAFIRWAGGGITYLNNILLVDRNDSGVSIGYQGSYPFKLSGTIASPIVLNIGQHNYTIFFIQGINNWGSIVGSYTDSVGVTHGFKRWSNGSVVSFDYPGASLTSPARINDNGTIVGYYVGAQSSLHGFVYHNGQFARLDFPNAAATVLNGISNSGVIVGTAIVNGATTDTAFIYENGAFKVISLPNQGGGTSNSVAGISLRLGFILGLASSAAIIPPEGFIATCN